MKLLTNGALLCYGLSLVGHVSKAAIGSFYMVLPAFKFESNLYCIKYFSMYSTSSLEPGTTKYPLP